MKLCLMMSEHYHTSIDYWLGLTIPEIYEWTMTAKELTEERNNG